MTSTLLSTTVPNPFGVAVQACWPSHGLSGWASQTQPQSSQSEHFTACQAYQHFCHESSLRPISATPRGPKGNGQTRRVSSVTHRAPGLLLPIEIRTDIGAPFATSLAGEPWLQIGQPDAIRPSVAADTCPKAALVIQAIDQQTANASGAHLGEGDLRLAGEGGHAPSKCRPDRLANPKAASRLQHSATGTPGHGTELRELR
jgi:hypothetical protein